jgi:hypothetical protein
VILDFRTESLDLLPDPVGWVLVAVGSRGLSLVSASWLAGLTAALSVSDAALPYRYVRIDPLTGDRVAPGERANVDLPLHLEFDPVSGWPLASMTLAMSAAGVTLWSLLRGLERRAHAHARSHWPAWRCSSTWWSCWRVRPAPRGCSPRGRGIRHPGTSSGCGALPRDHPLTRTERSGSTISVRVHNLCHVAVGRAAPAAIPQHLHARSIRR